MAVADVVLISWKMLKLVAYIIRMWFVGFWTRKRADASLIGTASGLFLSAKF